MNALQSRKRTVAPVRDLPSDFPNVPVRDDEASIDAAQLATKFIEDFGRTVEAGDWKSFGDFFAEQSWWKDNLTLTSDHRTIRGKSSIVSAWQSLAPRQPHAFKVANNQRIVQVPPAFTRMAPTLATLDIPFTYSISKPNVKCVGMAKAIPEGSSWKIWIVTTNVYELEDHPFGPLPRAEASNDVVPASQKGQAQPQGFPRLKGTLDALVVGAGCSGLGNTIMLESVGSNVAVFDAGQPGESWAKRYRSVRLHHNNFMIQLPEYPVPSDFESDYLKGSEVVEYFTRAVQDLKLPFFGGIKVARNAFNEAQQLWDVVLEDTKSGETITIQTRNLIISTGFIVSNTHPLVPQDLKDHGKFSGPVQHSTQYTTAEAYKGKRVVIVGSGNSAHDLAKDLADSNSVKSVTMLQRSPTALFDFDSLDGLVGAMYRGNIPVDTSDFLGSMYPLGIIRDMLKGALHGIAQALEELHSKLEAKGYKIDKTPDLISRAWEERGRSFYFDALKVFDFVLEDKILIAQGNAIGFSEKGLVVKDPETGAQREIEADGVVLATGFYNHDLPKEWADSGFLDAKSASRIENMGVPAVDEEGEAIGQVTRSGQPHLYFAGIGFSHARFIGRLMAIQVMADVHGESAEHFLE